MSQRHDDASPPEERSLRNLPLFAKALPAASAYTVNVAAVADPGPAAIPSLRPSTASSSLLNGTRAVSAPAASRSLTRADPLDGGRRPADRLRDVDWALVAALRSQAADRLTSALKGQNLDRAAQQELGRAIIVDLVQAAAADDVSEGRPTRPQQDQDDLAKAVFDAVFGMGRFQPLMEDPDVKNIMVAGCDRVFLHLTNGARVPGPPVAETDEDLVSFLAFVAAHADDPRPFSTAHPFLDLSLPNARLAASIGVYPRPVVVIRLHRHSTATLPDLVANGTCSSVAASFLSAATKARLSMVISGGQGAGKTTLMRAICREIPPWEAIGTFETDRELFLHPQPAADGHHHVVFSFQARPGQGERGPDGREIGEVTLWEGLIASLRYNLDRQIVGEVRGSEILAMFMAMATGTGSISTTHAPSAAGAIHRLVTAALAAGPQVTETYALRQITTNIQLIVHMRLETTYGADGLTERHYLDEIIALHPGEEARGYAVTQVFRPVPGGPAVSNMLPDELRPLTEHGFDLGAFLAESQACGGGTR